MKRDGQGGLVLSDDSGNYYLLSREVLEAARVSEEQKAVIARELGEEVRGYFTPIPIPEGSTLLTGNLTLLGFFGSFHPTGFDGGGGLGFNAFGR